MTTAPPWTVSAQVRAQMEPRHTVGSGPVLLEETVPRSDMAIRSG